MLAPVSSYGTSAGDPQNSHRWPTRSALNADTALQLWHCTIVFDGCRSFRLSGRSRRAWARSISSIGDTDLASW